MRPTLDPDELKRRLRQIPVVHAPDTMWDDIQARLRRPSTSGRRTPWLQPVRSPWLAAAAVLVALLGGAYVGILGTFGAPDRWQVVALSGDPTIAGVSIANVADIGAGEWLVTDSVSTAHLAVGRIGTANVGPGSRVRLDRSRGLRHQLTLERGSLHAVIGAPPRLFFVNTPSAIATDLGCAYTLEVDNDGASRIHVTAGWVELAQGGRTSLVAAGLAAVVDVGGAPGTPYPVNLPEPVRDALARLDGGIGSMDDLEQVIGSLATPDDFIIRRQESAITLWHLLQRLDGSLRDRVYERLAGLSAPPAGVTREGILALERPMLERWRRDLNPMWSEEAQPLLTRIARRLWEWTVR